MSDNQGGRHWNDKKFSRAETVAAIFFFASLVFHILLLTQLDNPSLRRMYYDTRNTPEPGRGVDFNALYTQGGNLLAGKSIYPSVEELTGGKIDEEKLTRMKESTPASDPENAKAYLPPYRYLPAAALVGWPFSQFEFWKAYNLWLLVHELLMFLSLIILFRSAMDRTLGFILCGMLLFFTPYFVELFMGQFSWIQAFLILLVLQNLDSGRPNSAKWAFIGSVLWKLNTLLWVIPLWRAGKSRWFITLAGAILIGSVPYFLLHPEDLKIFIGINIRPDLTHSYHFGNSGLRMVIDFLLHRMEFSSGGSVPDFLVGNLSSLIALALFAITVFFCWKRKNDLTGNLLIFGTLYFLIYVDVWAHHWLMILPIVIWEYKRTRSWFVFVLWLILALPNRFDWVGDFESLKVYFPNPEQVPNFGLAFLYVSQKAIPALLLWCWQINRLRRNASDNSLPDGQSH